MVSAEAGHDRAARMDPGGPEVGPHDYVDRNSGTFRERTGDRICGSLLHRVLAAETEHLD